MASFANSSHDNEGIPKPIGDFANLIRVGNMVGPGETNWVMMGQLLVGGHPGLVSQSNLVRKTERKMEETPKKIKQ